MSSGKADVMLAAVVYKEGLMNVYYSHPYFYNWYHLYLKSPENRPSSVLYSTIFFSKLTLFSLLVFCLLTMSIWMTSWYLNSTFKIERRLSIPTCFLGVMSGYINQGFDLKLRTYSGRLQATTALMFGLMLYYAMNAALVAKIAAFEAYYPFESLPDIVNRKTLSLCLRTSSFVYNNFTDGNRNILPQWQRIANNERCLDIEIPLNIPKIICNDNVVVLESKVVMGSLSMMAKYSCTIEAFGEKYFISGNSFLMSKALREKRIIDKYVIFMRSMGVIKRLENKWIKGDQTVTTKTSTPQVTLGHTKHVFIFYAIAILVSLIILGLEILHDKYVNADIKVIDYRN
ncbi:uncharacterized protein LOC111691474 [Anoplophora glabripennis]|uniref:uncharacterized protein LOC111691474 n=1 Tax=Anoplophora glabripennis TaxID=217634 RepID=UPI000C777A30|nr:uncharacterized protein LOC111691474 [Anoplophora glabripennis]